MFSDYGNMDIMLSDGNSNSIERELDSLIIVPDKPQDFQSFPKREIRLRKLRSETLIIEMNPSGKVDCWSQSI